MGSEKITALIVDDERLAVDGIKILLADFPQIRVIGSADCIKTAVDMIKRRRPDIIFLDIQLQGESGFDLFEKTLVKAKVIFITAYDQYAIRAFEVNALDYLLKPVSKKRFGAAMARIEKEPPGTRYDIPDAFPAFTYRDRLLLHLGHTLKFTRINRIKCVTAEGDYTRVWIHDDNSELILRTLKSWEEILPKDHFLRIHRSSIINLEFVQEVKKTTSNRFLVFLKEVDAPMVMSQRNAAKLRKTGVRIPKTP